MSRKPSTRPAAPADPLERARHLIETSDPTPTLSALADATGLSPTRLQRTFRSRFGVSPAEYARARRFGQFKHALRHGVAVTDAVYDAGFGSGSRVYEQSDRLLGMTPARYGRGGQGVSLRYTTTATPLGRMLVAATERGICAVTLGADDAELEARLQDEFPRATRQRIDAGRDEWLDAVIDRVAAELGWTDAEAPRMPPLDIAATAFQWRVWQALTRIPSGRTVSYGELARSLGTPSGARAVARACASNRLALVVPCHRVIREDGSLGGWRWGIERKRELLNTERARAS